jgi:hypothetical protein
VPDHDRPLGHPTTERRADVADEIRVELLADDAADVVGLEDARQVTHQCSRRGQRICLCEPTGVVVKPE